MDQGLCGTGNVWIPGIIPSQESGNKELGVKEGRCKNSMCALLLLQHQSTDKFHTSGTFLGFASLGDQPGEIPKPEDSMVTLLKPRKCPVKPINPNSSGMPTWNLPFGIIVS